MPNIYTASKKEILKAAKQTTQYELEALSEKNRSDEKGSDGIDRMNHGMFFSAFLIVPTELEHDSGYISFHVVLVETAKREGLFKIGPMDAVTFLSPQGLSLDALNFSLDIIPANGLVRIYSKDRMLTVDDFS